LGEILFHWNWKAGERETRLALAIDPNNAAAHTTLAICHLLAGENDRVVDEYEYACLLDPFSPDIRVQLYQGLYFTRRYEEAKERILAEKERLQGFFKYHSVLGLLAIQDHDWETAICEFQTAVEASGACSFLKARQGCALAASGRRDEAREIVQELRLLAKSRYVSATDFCVLFLGLGEMDEALHWLEKACAERATYLIFILCDGIFDPLRNSARFRDVVRRMGLPIPEA
jgi:tetratricopeptide (TPR) repeat protein